MSHSVEKELLRPAAEMLEIFRKNREGKSRGIYSVCSAHPLVLEAAMRQASQDQTILLIEATANQVNQFGGYTGMIPAEFPEYVYQVADRLGFPRERILLGGDHLGPLCWTDQSVSDAMSKACDLVAAYVDAGFKKIHLDTSMSCAGDQEPLSDEIVAERAASLCAAAERAANKFGKDQKPLYIVGTEVPVPGGATENVDDLTVTSVARFRTTVETHRLAFERAGLTDAWARVIAVVVQPGVEFNHTDIHPYDRSQAQELSQAVLQFPNLVFEAHSTDYQPREVYGKLVEDHFAILKVGPQLTFALREALFSLNLIENELCDPNKLSGLISVCENAMLTDPSQWNKHYPNTEPEGRMCRRFSYSDRVRYYWTNPEIDRAFNMMMNNLKDVLIPLPLLSQFLPGTYESVQAGSLAASAEDLIQYHIMSVIALYSEACN